MNHFSAVLMLPLLMYPLFQKHPGFRRVLFVSAGSIPGKPPLPPVSREMKVEDPQSLLLQLLPPVMEARLEVEVPQTYVAQAEQEYNLQGRSQGLACDEVDTQSNAREVDDQDLEPSSVDDQPELRGKQTAVDVAAMAWGGGVLVGAV